MNVLFLSTWFPAPPDNGSKVRILYLLRALGIKHRVTLLSFAFGSAAPEDADGLSRFCEGVQVVRRNPFRPSRWASMLRFLSPVPIVTLPVPEMTHAVRDFMTRTAVDVVIASTQVMAPYALLAPEGTTKILEEHNSMSRWMWERYRAQTSSLGRLRCWASWQKMRIYEAWLFGRFDLCTMVSAQDRAASLRMLPGYRRRIEVVSNGVDCRHNQPDSTPIQPNTLVYNGALTYVANYDAMRHFLQAIYPLIRLQVPDVTLTITGSTEGVDLEGLRLDQSVRLSGYVDDVRSLVAGATVAIAPIRRGGGTRLKILEAMALGTPVVATTKGAEGLEVLGDKHLLLADEPGSFAEHTVRLLRDPALRSALAANARRLVEQRYDWNQIGKRFVTLIEKASQGSLP